MFGGGWALSWRVSSVADSMGKEASGPSDDARPCIVEVIPLLSKRDATRLPDGARAAVRAGGCSLIGGGTISEPWSALYLPPSMAHGGAGGGGAIVELIMRTLAALYRPLQLASPPLQSVLSQGEGEGPDYLGCRLAASHPSMARLLGVVIVPGGGHALVLFELRQHQSSLRNLVRFCSAELAKDSSSALFMTYQMLHLLDDAESRGVPLGYLSDSGYLVDDTLWLTLASVQPALGLGRSLEASMRRLDLESATR